MARPLRIEYSGAFYHITSRGNEKQLIFFTDQDRKKFLNLLKLVIDRTDWICHSYVLMGNHYHLLIETPKPNLSRGMRQLNGVYTQFFNWNHNRVGHLFQGRFKALLVEKDNYLIELCRYLLLNPVRAGFVKDPGDYRWSSYKAIIGKVKCPEFLTTNCILSQFGSDSDTAVKEFKKLLFSCKTMSFPTEEIAGQLILGSKKFINKMEKYLLRHDRLNDSEISKKQRYVFRMDLDEIYQNGIKEGKTRNELIYKAFREYDYYQKEIADYLRIHYATVSRAIKKIEEKKK